MSDKEYQPAPVKAMKLGLFLAKLQVIKDSWKDVAVQMEDLDVRLHDGRKVVDVSHIVNIVDGEPTFNAVVIKMEPKVQTPAR
jgi:hypothetical protein